MSTEWLAELYATCSAVYYAPVDEDFGMGPYEAFLSAKPVITTTDAGGPLDVVHDGRTGLVVDPDAYIGSVGDLNQSFVTDVSWRNLVGESSGEAFSLRFEGHGVVHIQPQER